DAGFAKHSRSGQLDCFVAELDALGTGRDHELITEVRAAVHDGDAAGPVPVTDLDRQADEPVGPEVVAAGVLDPEARERRRLDRKNSTSAVPRAQQGDGKRAAERGSGLDVARGVARAGQTERGTVRAAPAQQGRRTAPQ